MPVVLRFAPPTPDPVGAEVVPTTPAVFEPAVVAVATPLIAAPVVPAVVALMASAVVPVEELAMDSTAPVAEADPEYGNENPEGIGCTISLPDDYLSEVYSQHLALAVV